MPRAPGADWCVLVSMLVLSLSEQLARSGDRLSLSGIRRRSSMRAVSAVKSTKAQSLDGLR